MLWKEEAVERGSLLLRMHCPTKILFADLLIHADWPIRCKGGEARFGGQVAHSHVWSQAVSSSEHHFFIFFTQIVAS